MMEQFEAAKREQPDCLLFFRMGDFYELFGEDAKVASRELGIALTTTIDDRPIMTSFGAVLTCLSNMGPAPFYVGADNFASYSPVMKIIFSVLMLLGRLEFFALLSLLAAGFWKR